MIAAVARNGVIGNGNRVPWRLPGDLAHFRSATMGRPLILGRRTHDSIGRALPGRFPVVLSRDASFHPPDVSTARDLVEALAQAETIGCQQGSPEIMVGGGGSIYAALLPHATRLFITHVDLSPDGDAFFPPIDPKVWRIVASYPTSQRPDDDASYVFVRYERDEEDN